MFSTELEVCVCSLQSLCICCLELLLLLVVRFMARVRSYGSVYLPLGNLNEIS